MNCVDDEIRESSNFELLEDNEDWVDDKVYWDEYHPDLKMPCNPHHPAVISEFVSRGISGQ